MPMLAMNQVDLKERRVLIREDLNVPIDDGKVANDQRIRAALPTITTALEAGAQVMVLSHLGRPQEGHFDAQYSLAPVADYMAAVLAMPVPLQQDWLDGVSPEAGRLVLCENVRFNPGEKANDQALARKMAALCDVFVMDAFGSAHRAHASTHGVARYAPIACAGPLLTAELDALARAMADPARPLLAVVGGAKVSTKLGLLERLCQRVDQLIVGGGIANTFLAAAGYAIGQSLHEPDLIEQARKLLDRSGRDGMAEIPLPQDVVVAEALSEQASARVVSVDQVGDGDLILDIGPDAVASLQSLISAAGTVVWNGPVGVFEVSQFAGGTAALARAIAASDAFSIAGGGDTLAAIDRFGVADAISYISTGGGAFLAFLEGQELPAVSVLKR